MAVMSSEPFRSPWAVLVALALVFVAGRVVADSIPPLPTCPAWQMVRVRGSRHSGADCVPRTCRRSSQCGAGSHCGSRYACFARHESWQGGGPCLDQDGDGDCDNRHRVVETVEVGPCDAHRACGEGTCRRVRECTAPP
jgi:hypothetical protein